MKKDYKTIGTITIGIIIFLFFLISYFSGGSSELNKNDNESIFVEENESMEVITKKEEEKETVKIVVDIKGEIKNPNIYWLEEGCIIEDLINVAGGITEEGDLSKINRAQKLNDHEVVIIPNINDKESEIESIIPSSNNENKVNINTASINELDTLSGIGPSKAEAIIKYREENGTFKSIEEIKNVTGIGEALFEKFKENITI